MTAPSRGAARHGTVAAALAAAFVLRAAAGCALNVDSGVHRGFDFYGFMADHILDGRGLYWAFYDGLGDKWANRAPLYPLLVAGIRRAVGTASPYAVVVAQAAIGAAACLVPAAIARRWAGTGAASAALWTAALWPYSVLADTGLVEHVLFAPLACLAILAAADAASRAEGRSWLLAGAAAGAATLSRLTFGAAALLLATASSWTRPRLTRFVLYVAGTALVLSPWVLRNRAVTGAWVIGTDSGRALWVGNAPSTFRSYPRRSIDDAERELVRDLDPADRARLMDSRHDEVAQDRTFRAMALSSIAARPLASVWGAVRKAAALWSPVMNPGPVPAGKLALFGAMFAGLAAATLAAIARVPRLRADLPVVLAAASGFTATAAVFWGQSRYLAPLHGIGIAAAAALWTARRPTGAGAA